MAYLKKGTVPALFRLFPYCVLLLAGIIAFSPVSFMLFAIKNDAIALDYPVKYFISQCLHNNTQPFWFNTWAMGFPIESIITWSLFSPLQFFFGGIFHYTLYTLHVEFMFYIVISGCGMFYFLQKHISQNTILNLLLAACYMLSGFTAGSSQWLIYMSAQALTPFILICSFNLLKAPSVKTSLLFVACFYTMLTSVYPAFTIAITYLLLCLTGFFLIKKYLNDRAFFSRTGIIRHLIRVVLILAIICIPALFYTFQVLQNIQRGQPIQANTDFFNSNFVPLKGFLSLLIPLSAPKIQAANTEGTMTDIYMGLLPILLLPVSIIVNNEKRNWSNYIFLFLSIFFLVLSTGHLTPLRKSLNILPGFSYFRNPGLFRLFFIQFNLIYLSATFSKFKICSALTEKSLLLIIRFTILMILVLFVLLAICNYQPFNFRLEYFNVNRLKEFVDRVSYPNLIFISACLQFILLLAAFWFYKLRCFRLVALVFLLDPVINCLICTPFFTISSYSVKQTNDLLKSTNGFPIQRLSPSKVTTNIHLNKATWYNINVYQKKISSLNSYFGPLTLKNFQPDSLGKASVNKLIVFSNSPTTAITITHQKPNYVSALIKIKDSSDYIFFQQNFYPGWEAYFNNKHVNVSTDKGKMRVQISRNGVIEFKYERDFLFIVTIIINILIIGTIFILCFLKQKPNQNH